MKKQIRSASSNIASSDGVKQLILAYNADKHSSISPDWKPKSGFIYAVVRAISARINQNFDAWPSKELRQSVHLWPGKPIFVNHQNEDPQLARGKVIAARYVDAGNGDRYIETIMEVDAKRFPKLAKELRIGGLDSVSMGVEAGFTICSICENRATDFTDMCSHIKFHKGEHLKNKKTGKKTLVYENCHKLSWFELSFVFDPADETAVVSRVIAANKEPRQQIIAGAPWTNGNGKQQALMGDGHSLHVFAPHHAPAIVDQGNLDVLAPASGNSNFEWVHTHNGEPINRGVTPSSQEARRQAEQSHHELSGHWDPDKDPFDPREFQAMWYKKAYGEQEAPEEIDTLRDESEDDTDDFHHWIESPPELRAPDMDKTKRLDRDQENDGLDADRRSEDVEEFSVPAHHEPEFHNDEHEQPVMPINPPVTKKGRRTKTRGVSMARYHYAEDDADYEDGDDTETEDSAEDVDALVDEAEQDLEDYQSDSDDSDDDSDEDDSDPDDDDSDEEADTDDDYADDDDESDDSDDDEEDSDQPPWLQKKESRRRRTVSKRNSRRNKRKTSGGVMAGSTLAQRGKVAARRRHADDSGYTDGGPYGEDDSQGNQEEVFISEVPSSEAVCAPADDDGDISNSPNNLVASRPQFDPNHYQRLADVVAALPPIERRTVAENMVRAFKADNNRFNELTFYKEAMVPMVKKGSRYFFAEELEDAQKVDPPLSGTDVQDLKGDDFGDVALETVETQPKDASIHAFREFDRWLQSATGRTARQHSNANYIRRAAASYVKTTGRSLEGLFPTLEYVLREARKVEDREANVRRYAEDTSLDVAAPNGRVDVEAPVKNVTDEKAQASQFDLNDFAHNAGDDLADPDLDVVRGNAGTWAPDKGKESAVKLASGVEALRCAEAYIAAMPNTYKSSDRFTLTARFETMRQPVVRERIRLLEAVTEDQAKTKTAANKKVAAVGSRGTKSIPPGLGSGQRVASSRKVAASDPDTDSLMFFS